MNALQYMKNVGKSLGYATIDVTKSYNSSAVALATNAKELGSDLYQSIKDFKETSTTNRSEKSLTGEIKDSVKEIRNSIFADLKTGNWYNKQRIKQVDDEMMSEIFGGDLSFDFDDDFGDFEFEDDFDDDGTSSIVKQQISNEQQSTKSIISSMDMVGAKMAGAVSTASVKSADYIVSSQRESSKAIYALTNRGFNQVSVGLAAVNASINNLVKLGEPLTAHMQNASLFYSRSDQYQKESIDLLKKLVENTSPTSPKGSARKGPKYTIDDVLSNGALDLKAYSEMLKESVKDMTSMVTSLVDMMGGVKGIGKNASKSPLAELLKFGISGITPKSLKNASKEFDESLENFFAAGIEKLRNKTFDGTLGTIFELFKSSLLPSSGYKSKLDPSRYNKGKVDWDGISRKALTEVIPFQLSQIVSALTGRPLEVYNFETGKWIKKSSIRSDFEDQKRSFADRAGGDYIYNAKSTVRDLSNKKKISAKDKDRMIKEIENYNTYAFHSDDSEFMNIDNDNFNYKKFGMSKETWEFMRQYNKSLSKNNKKSTRFNYAGEIARGRSSFGNYMRNTEAEGSIYNMLFDDSINDTEKTRTLLGVDEYNNDIFYYLQGIYLATTHLSDNIEVFSTGSGKRIKGASIQKNGKISPIRSLSARPMEKDKKDVNEKIGSSKQAIKHIEAADIEASTLNSFVDNKLPKELMEYVRAKQEAEEKGIPLDPKYNDKKDEYEKQLLTYGGYDKVVKDIKKWKSNNPTIQKIGNAVEKLLKVPADAVSELLYSAQVSMERLLFGKGSNEDQNTLSSALTNGFKSFFDGLKDKLDSLFPGLSEYGSKAFEIIFGKKNEDGTRSGGIGSGLFNSTVGELKNVGKWVKGVFTGNAATGRRVTKTGLVAVSEGELIIPSEYNPFYNKKTDKRSQLKNEMISIKKFYGNYAPGGTVESDNVEVDENGNIKGNQKGTGEVKKDAGAFGVMKNFLGQGFSFIGKGFVEFLQGIAPNRNKNIEEEKGKISKIASAALEDIGDSKGAAAAGALIGGGVSLLTGALVGPVLGAGIGAATGLIIRSDKVKNALFGEVDEKTGDRKGDGILSKNITDFLTKNIPGMAKGATVGGAAGLFMGSPVLGAILGSTVGYISSSDKAKNALFGDVDKETGERKGGFFSKELQKAVKDRMPGISAGAIAGLVAGPFGLAGNLVVGSALGYAASSDKFKNWLFGEENEKGKREGGLVGLIKDNLINPLVGIFDKLSEEIKHHVKNTFFSLGKSIRNFILKRLGGKVGSKIKSGASKVIDKITGGTLGGVGNILKSANKGLEKRALKKGYSIKDREKGRNLRADERLELRGENDRSVYGQFDSILSQINSEDELNDLNTLIGSMIDPTKVYDEQIIKSRKSSKNLLDSLNDAGASNVYKLIKKKKFDEASSKLETLNIDQDTKSKISNEIQVQRDAWDNRNKAKANVSDAKNKFLQNSKFKNLVGLDLANDTDLRNFQDLISDESSKFTELSEKKQEEEKKEQQKAVTKTIPDLLKDILQVMMRDPETMKKYASNPEQFKSDGLSDIIKEKIEGKNNSESIVEPNEGDRQQAEDGTVQVYTNGKWEFDLTDNYTKATISKKEKVMDALIGIPVIGKGISKLTGLFGTVKEKLFGKGDEEGKNKGFFTKILENLNGENGPLKLLTNLFTGSPLGQAISTGLSKITLRSVLSNFVAPALFGAAFFGKFDDLFSKFGWGKADNEKQTAVTNDGVQVTYNSETGKYVDDNGNEYDPNQVNSSSIKIQGIDKANFSDKLKYNTARGLLTNTRSVASVVLGRTAIGRKAGAVIGNYALNISKISLDGIEGSAALLTISDDVTSGIFKVFNVLKKVPVLKNLDLDGMANTLSVKITNKLASSSAQKIAQFAANAVIWARIIFAVADFTTGYEDAATTLKIKDPTVGQRIIAGLLRTLKNCIPIVGTLIPDDLLIDIFVEYIAPFFGMDVEEFKNERTQAQAELDAYNAENGTNMDWSEYNKSVRKDYTWTERIGNSAKSTIASTKQKWNNMKEGITEKGLGGYLKDSVSSMADTFTESYDKNGGGISGSLSATGDVMKNLLPGILGDIAKANLDINAFAAKGDLKGLWGVSLPDFSNSGDPNEAKVGIFSKIIGQIPLIVNKVSSTPFAIISWIGGKIKNTVSNFISKVMENVNYITNQETIGEQIFLNQDSELSDFLKIEDPPESPISGIVKVAAFGSRISSIPILFIKKAGSSIGKFVGGIKDKIVNGVSAIVQNQIELEDLSKQGDVSGLLNHKAPEDDEGNPANGFMKAINLSNKISLFIPTAFHWAGNKIFGKISDIVSKSKDNFGLMQDGVNNMKEAAEDGKLSSVWNEKLKLNSEDPIHNITNGIFGISKIFYCITAMLKKISEPFAEAIESASEWIEDASEFVGEKVDDVKEGASDIKDKAVSGVTNFASSAYNTVQGWFGGNSSLSAAGSGFVSQIDPRYANKGIGNSTVAQLGCGPASAVMALNQAGKSVSMNNAINSANRYQTGSGTDIAYFGDYFRKNGMNASYYDGVSAAGKSNIINSIRSGQPTILMGQDLTNRSKSYSPFGPNNHYVVASGIDSRGNIIINDPESNRGGRKYSPSILNSVKVGVGVSGAGSFIKRRFGFSGAGNTVYSHELRIDDTTKAVWSFFRSKGYSEAATAGIMGNLQQESGIDPTRHQIKGTARGICQWEGGRFTNMCNYASSKGKDWTDLNCQLEFMHQEIQGLGSYFSKNANTTVQGFMSMTDVVTATDAFEKAFERAGKPAMENRYKYAKYYYENFTGKTYNYDPSVGEALAGSTSSIIDGSTSTTGSSSSSSGVASAVKGFGLLSTITNAFSKIGDLFTGTSSSSSDTSSYSTGGVSSTNSGSTIDASSGVNANPTGITYSGKTPVDILKSIQGKIQYSMSGPRDPEKGSADCSSTVQWAIKKATGIDIGGSTPAQYENSNLENVWYGNGSVANSLPDNIQPNDVLFFSRNKSYTEGRKDRVGHVEIYAGDGKMIGIGSGTGPTLKNVPLGMGSSGGLIKVARVSASAAGSGLVDNTSAKGSRLLLLNSANRNSNPFVNDRVVYRNNYRGGRLSAGESDLPIYSNRNNSRSGISKDTAALLKVIISLIESVVKNTDNINNIYELLTNYCKANLGSRAEEAISAVKQAQESQSNSLSESVEKSLESLKSTVDSILAS